MSKTFKDNVLRLFLVCIIIHINTASFSQNSRETINFNFDWKFALGHASDVSKDFNFNSSYFSYLAKTGFGDGAAAEKFDDRAWRQVQLPHDWCVTLPFDAKGSNSHGSKAIGRNFPENSIGWYRKQFFIPQSDTARRIRIEFEGVYRNSKVFVNGFYVGTEESGYSSFGYDITEYLNFGGNNTIAVRVDATEEEGWFYEGAGIYRNVWLVKTNKVHFSEEYPTQIIVRHREALGKNITASTVIVNYVIDNERQSNVQVSCNAYVYNSSKQIIDSSENQIFDILKSYKMLSLYGTSYAFSIKNPQLWSIENPYLYTVKLFLKIGEKVVDIQEIPFGLRTVSIDANNGLFINNKPVKIKGVCMHQDHAGVGVAIPYELQKWRIQQLKNIGVNAIRTSHNPPSPDLLNICDELGILVLDEVRLMGINEYHKTQVSQQIKRDRNHPSVFMWSLGNEEWAIEGNEKGAKIIENMQEYAKMYDTTRPYTVASSGGWDTGIGMKNDVMGYNYLSHGDVDAHHAKFPWQPSIGTEESNTVRTRGIYSTIDTSCWLAPKNLYDGGMEGGWKFYDARPYLAGLFYWTGFDYRGEPTPYGWPAVVSQFGILDLCGFPKDNAYYLKSWWTKKPVLQIESNWNRKPGEKFDLQIYSNAKQVELVLNGKSLGRKSMEKNGHITWPIIFEPGTLVLNAYDSYILTTYDSTKVIFSKEFKTAGQPFAMKLIPQKESLSADGSDVSIITVQILDSKGNIVPDANIPISFDLQGTGKIIGVGNGNPSSHENEIFEDKIETTKITISKELPISNLENRPEIAVGFDDSKWRSVYSAEPANWLEYTDTLLVFRGEFMLNTISDVMKITLFSKSILDNQSLYINGKLIKANIKKDSDDQTYILDHSILKSGKNEYVVVGQKLKRPNQWDFPNRDPGLIQVITPANKWSRNSFNGLAQIIVQSTKKAGVITLKATAPGLQSAEIKIQTK
jgi:beta-galactosidase